MSGGEATACHMLKTVLVTIVTTAPEVVEDARSKNTVWPGQQESLPRSTWTEGQMSTTVCPQALHGHLGQQGQELPLSK